MLSPLAVMPGYQKRGIGSALVRKGLKVLARRAVPLVFLEGDLGYYSRFGFAPGADLGFRKPSLRIPDGAFQAIRLPEYEPWMTGTLVYAEPFRPGQRSRTRAGDMRPDEPMDGRGCSAVPVPAMVTPVTAPV